ncbi:MAG: hypothetical protein M3Y87_15810, partial [Myxococcota bacterium]|nr:hypothetical protein [Myxococcota bacterium]
MMRALLTLTALSAVWTSSLTARAQGSVQLCVPQEVSAAMRDALAMELRARGHDVHVGCAPASDAPARWAVSIESADPLADVWVRAVGSDGEERRARVGGPLDTLDERALALTAASLVEEEPVIA